jgi:hypothetical protein
MIEKCGSNVLANNAVVFIGTTDGWMIEDFILEKILLKSLESQKKNKIMLTIVVFNNNKYFDVNMAKEMVYDLDISLFQCLRTEWFNEKMQNCTRNCQKMGAIFHAVI